MRKTARKHKQPLAHVKEVYRNAPDYTKYKRSGFMRPAVYNVHDMVRDGARIPEYMLVNQNKRKGNKK